MHSWCHGYRPEPQFPLGRAGWTICGAQVCWLLSWNGSGTGLGSRCCWTSFRSRACGCPIAEMAKIAVKWEP